MKKPIVAIYSGDVPSTTFIENLVRAVAETGTQVYLFGTIKKPVRYHFPNIQIFAAPRNKFLFGMWLGWNSLKLAIIDPEKHRKLNVLVHRISASGKNPTIIRARYLPVFLHTPDIIHVQWAKAAADWIPIKEMLGIRLILSFRGAHINYSPLADPELAKEYRDVFPNYDAFHAVSGAIATESKKYGTGKTLMRVIHSGIDTALLGKYNTTIRGKVDGKKLKLISVGRFHWKKGYYIAFEAIRKLKSEGFEIQYELIAGGNNEEAIYLVHDMGIQNAVVFLDNMPQAKVFERMAGNDLLLLPSVEEGIANVVLEAMALGLPVLSSDCGGMTEAIEDGKSGLLYRNRDINHLAERIRHFSGLGTEARLEMTSSAREQVQANFSLERLGKEMVTFYNDVLDIKSTQ